MAMTSNNTTSVSFFGPSPGISSRFINHKFFAYKNYGGIFSAYDTVRKEKVLIRAIINPYESKNEIIKVLNEIKLMKYFNHENIIQLYSIEEFKNEAGCSLFLITEFMDAELNQILRSPCIISNNHIQYFMYCILRGLLCVHSAEVVLGNLSLEEIFVNSNEDVKIVSFSHSIASGKESLSEEFAKEPLKFLFLAPEYYLNKNYITTKSDIWSVGCIMAALLGKRLVFIAEDYIRQIVNIVNLLGCPNEEDLIFVGDRAAEFIRRIPEKPKRLWNEIYPEAEPLALDFLDKMLVFNPLRRWDTEKLIQHPYLTDLYLSDDDIRRAMPFEFDYHDKSIDIKILKKQLKAEIRNFVGKI
ncbi:unnamed protein product [Blepharisma stoltei]|uniref:Protein kinase domain-containing protein n=1 Tax=Blepharisma stoltei TaxID=1481888 RepID=A0AAU9KAA0_9CILI|nr:unnamed protein product [Blepharisma stoltei]